MGGLTANLSGEPSSDLRIDVEEGFHADAQLFFDFFFRPFQDVHRHVGFAPILQVKGGLPYFGHLVSGQQTHSVYQSQIGHAPL